jgi:hypothetical protein
MAAGAIELIVAGPIGVGLPRMQPRRGFAEKRNIIDARDGADVLISP